MVHTYKCPNGCGAALIGGASRPDGDERVTLGVSHKDIDNQFCHNCGALLDRVFAPGKPVIIIPDNMKAC